MANLYPEYSTCNSKHYTFVIACRYVIRSHRLQNDLLIIQNIISPSIKTMMVIMSICVVYCTRKIWEINKTSKMNVEGVLTSNPVSRKSFSAIDGEKPEGLNVLAGLRMNEIRQFSWIWWSVFIMFCVNLTHMIIDDFVHMPLFCSGHFGDLITHKAKV